MKAARTKGYLMRALGPDETELLAHATLENVNWSGQRFTMEQLRSAPELAHYFAPWPAEREFGTVAETADAASPIGVAWARLFEASDPGYGFVDEHTPEVSVWVATEHRRNGLGAALLARVIERARELGFPAISLSVEHGNPARRLYERLGFLPAPAAEPGTMILRFPS